MEKYENPLKSQQSDTNGSKFTKFNINSKEFVPTPFMSSFPQPPQQQTKTHQSMSIEEQRLRKLAKQLNSLGVLDDESSSADDETGTGEQQNKLTIDESFPQTNSSKSPAKSHNSSASSGIGTTGSTSLVSSLRMMAEQTTSSGPVGFDSEQQKTISQKISVPSSEHVAEIVGKQGCKIKALRTKTNTYIKTPARGEDPNFVITGHRADVESAIKEIQEAADHFTMIRQQRSRQHFLNNQMNAMNHGGGGSNSPYQNSSSPFHNQQSNNSLMHQHQPTIDQWNMPASSSSSQSHHRQSSPRSQTPINMRQTHTTTTPPSSSQGGFGGNNHFQHNHHRRSPTQQSFGGYTLDHIPDSLLAKQITLKVRVPYNVVGLVVGPKGSTIKRIQQMTQTYIVTPSRDKEPVFEVTGLSENVERAREEIQSHIASRTGSNQLDADEEFNLNGKETELPDFDDTNNPLRPVRSTTPPFITTQTNQGGGSSSLFQQSSTPSPNSALHPNPLRQAFIDHEAKTTISTKSTFDSDAEENHHEGLRPAVKSDSDKDNALETLQKLTPEEKIKLAEVIEKMKAEKAKRKSEKSKSIFEPSTLKNIKPAPSIDNVLIGKATPVVSNNPIHQINRHHLDQNRIPAEYMNQLGPNMHSHSDNNRNTGNILAKVATNPGQKNSIPSIAGVNRAGKCLVCRERPISMALVPCGHNLFCEECAMRITHGNKNSPANPVCPECFEPVNMAIQIKM